MAGETPSPEGAVSLESAAAAPASEVVVAPVAPGTVLPVAEAAADSPPQAEPAAAEAPAEPLADKPVEAAPEAKVEAEPVPEPVVEAPITYDAFKLPEGLTPSDEILTPFTELLSQHKLSQEDGQKLIDLHTTALKEAVQAMDQRQRDVFEETRAGWRKDFDKQAGNRKQTLVNDAKWLKTQILPDQKARDAFDDAMGYTGMGDHPAFIGFMAATAKKLRERSAPAPSLPAKGAPTAPWDKRYSNGAQR
jgi:hypothetical protein